MRDTEPQKNVAVTHCNVCAKMSNIVLHRYNHETVPTNYNVDAESQTLLIDRQLLVITTNQSDITVLLYSCKLKAHRHANICATTDTEQMAFQVLLHAFRFGEL
jgi:hypothetical protein